jgi:hypothetical protein
MTVHASPIEHPLDEGDAPDVHSAVTKNLVVLALQHLVPTG